MHACSRGGATVHGSVSHVALCAKFSPWTMPLQIPLQKPLSAGCCGSNMCIVDPCQATLCRVQNVAPAITAADGSLQAGVMSR